MSETPAWTRPAARPACGLSGAAIWRCCSSRSNVISAADISSDCAGRAGARAGLWYGLAPPNTSAVRAPPIEMARAPKPKRANAPAYWACVAGTRPRVRAKRRTSRFMRLLQHQDLPGERLAPGLDDVEVRPVGHARPEVGQAVPEDLVGAVADGRLRLAHEAHPEVEDAEAGGAAAAAEVEADAADAVGAGRVGVGVGVGLDLGHLVGGAGRVRGHVDAEDAPGPAAVLALEQAVARTDPERGVVGAGVGHGHGEGAGLGVEREHLAVGAEEGALELPGGAAVLGDVEALLARHVDAVGAVEGHVVDAA